jgi:hypothetical protein
MSRSPRVPAPEEKPTHPLVSQARNVLRIWDLELVSTGNHAYIQGPGRKQFLIVEGPNGITFEKVEP